jgi:hypothetical protein
MKQEGIALAGRVAVRYGQLPQCVHHRGDVNVIWAVCGTNETSGAQPYIPAAENSVALVERRHPQHPVRAILHRLHDGATSRAFVAVVAEFNVLTGQAIYFGRKALPLHFVQSLP